MKKFICSLILTVVVLSLKGQIVSLDKKEIALMRKAINAKKQYKKAFEPI
ncbi:hypothetical protein NAF17_01365 [Mucilaginibacter sp. RB4R14]|nr:hypothetical protein [Mucilaginibacter aurantiaciroseus]MCO5934173.1 hypothetical protein [Mucilaginibacter aurantiaciroseus]